jgi:RNA polymerase sigma factor (sigma-70 family)
LEDKLREAQTRLEPSSKGRPFRVSPASENSSSIDALSRVIREHGEMLRRVARGYCYNPQDAEDLMQEILMALWQALPKFRGEAAERTFILRVAHNRAITFAMRRHSFAPLATDVEADPAPLAEARLIDEEKHERLFRAIRTLPDAQHQAVLLYLEGLSQREIAELQGTTEGNIGVRLNRARNALRVLLREEES